MSTSLSSQQNRRRAAEIGSLTSARAVRFRFGDATAELRTECVDLYEALVHIYGAFVENELSTALPCGRESSWAAILDGQSFEFDDFDEAVLVLEDEIANLLLRDVADCLLIHAAAVSDASGSYLLVGPSGHGKTTLALEFVRRGLVYLTDEYTAIESCGTAVRPFPRSAVQKFDSQIAVGRNFEVPKEDGYRSHLLPDRRAELKSRPIDTCRIIFPRHSPEAAPSARPLNAAESCARLMPSIFDFDGNETNLWPVMANMVTRARACELSYQDARTDLDLALDLLG